MLMFFALINLSVHIIILLFQKKGEEQVSSKHESAFAIGMVAAGLWRESPSIGELLLAHFHAQCPYLVPFYIPRQEGQSDADFFRWVYVTYKYTESIFYNHEKPSSSTFVVLTPDNLRFFSETNLYLIIILK